MARAGTATFDFSTDPTQDPKIIINGGTDPVWRSTGGNPGGFLALLYSINSTAEAIVFPDIDNGQTVKAFTFETDLRIGNAQGNAGRPADGFSISFARDNDAVLSGLPDSANGNNMAAPGQPENGTATGIAIGFDTWQGNILPDDPAGDIEGIIVRVDNKTILKYGMPTRNGACEDATSLQTGPYDDAYWTTGAADPQDPAAWAGLCWAHLKVELDEQGKLTVTYKNKVVLDHFQTTYFPSIGRLVLAGRTGGANENTHFDNIKLTTVPSAAPLLTGLTGTADGFTAQITDAVGAEVDTATVTVKLDGAAITPASVTKSGLTTTISYKSPTNFASGSEHPVELTYKDKNGTSYTATRSFTVPTYVTIPPEFAVAAGSVDKTKPGFSVFPYQVDAALPNTIAVSEQVLAGAYRAADGSLLPNIADLSGADATGHFTVADVVNFNEHAPDAVGNFSDANGHTDAAVPGIPGTGGGADNYVEEIITYLDLPAGSLTMGFNSDDGFRTTSGNIKDAFAALVLGQFNGGRGAADTLFNIYVPQAGIYPFRTIWFEGGGDSNAEWFTINDGNKVLINDTVAGAIKAYRAGPAGPAYIKTVSPAPGASGVPVKTDIAAVLVDAGTQIDQASIKLNVNGEAVTPKITKTGAQTEVAYTVANGLTPGGKYNAEINFKDSGGAPRTAAWSFQAEIPTSAFVAGTLFIEAEDVDYNHGQYVKNAKIGMDGAYPGGAYANLGTADDKGFDWNVDSNNGQTYRPDTALAAGKENGSAGDDRGLFQVTSWWTLGWNDGGEWYNYTRDFPTPAKDYAVYGHLSSGGAPINIQLDQITSGQGQDDSKQVKKLLGYFAPGRATAGWDNLEIFQLTDANGEPAIVNLGGNTTLRTTILAGSNSDQDYYAFVPSTAPPAKPKFTKFSLTGGNFVIEWTGTGKLQSTAALPGGWADVSSATSPYSTTPSDAARYFRLTQ